MSLPFLRLFIALITLQSAPAAGTISGIVIKGGTTIPQPLQNARVELTGPALTLVTRTGSNGRFTFANLLPGAYRIEVTRDGFIRQAFSKRVVLGGGQNAGDVVFALDAAPTAAGRVLDIYGEPIPNVLVEALNREYDVRGNIRMSRAASALTDDRGDYRIFWLDPGEYFFYAASLPPGEEDLDPPPPVAPTYFPGVNTPEEAKTVRLDIGREVPVDFRLRAAALWSIDGQTMQAATGRSIGASITLISPGKGPASSRHTQSSPTGAQVGRFSIDRVAPGSYFLVAKAGAGGLEITAIQRIEIRPVLIAPTNGPPVYLSLGPPQSIAGRIVTEVRQAADLRASFIALQSVDPELPSPSPVFIRPDGLFTVNGIMPGTYVLDMSNLPQDLYVKAARYGEDDILEQPLTLVTRDAPKAIQIALGSDGGHLQVAAYSAKNEVHPGAQFVLVPDTARRRRRDQYRVATAGADGQAMFQGIPPGKYKLFAWEHLEPNAYLNAEYLALYEDSGLPVTIVPGDNRSTAVRTIPR